MPSGFNRQIRGFGGSTSNTTNSSNITSDNYSYYIKSEEQEAYKHKNAKWDPGRSFSSQYGDANKKDGKSLAFAPNDYFKSNADDVDNGVNIYPSDSFNLNAGITESQLDATSRGVNTGRGANFNEELLKKRGLVTPGSGDSSRSLIVLSPIMKISGILILCIALTFAFGAGGGGDAEDYDFEAQHNSIIKK